MPIFRFEILEFGKTETIEIDVPNAEAACAQAVLAARNALTDGVAEKIDRSASVTKIYDEAGYLVGTINYADHITDVRLPKENTDEPPSEEPGVMRSG